MHVWGCDTLLVLMGRQLAVSSLHPKLSGNYLESGSSEGRPTYVRSGLDGRSSGEGMQPGGGDSL